ncbi:hypothetical protein F444_00631 [Phytophthora nicotianae P1976]|uniref:Uncharacterized protein n=1 Tax=Phytophthora nicotianae P1976 TaxID=1317066 RepID=A0A081B3P3_PHYNI|nr:hypothetical protein F444_00631 [Phytophthora nicotianae P1976]
MVRNLSDAKEVAKVGVTLWHTSTTDWIIFGMRVNGSTTNISAPLNATPPEGGEAKSTKQSSAALLDTCQGKVRRQGAAHYRQEEAFMTHEPTTVIENLQS